MLTANYLISRSNLRPEFVNSDILTYTIGLDVMVNPIDAPEVIAAGSFERVQAFSHDGYYGIPTVVSRG